jgi:mono/diheme cytochrome c family protein
MQRILRGTAEAMPSFRKRLTPEQLQAVAAYVATTAGE